MRIKSHEVREGFDGAALSRFGRSELMVPVAEPQVGTQLIVFVIVQIEPWHGSGADLVPVDQVALDGEGFGNAAQIFAAKEIRLRLRDHHRKGGQHGEIPNILDGNDLVLEEKPRRAVRDDLCFLFDRDPVSGLQHCPQNEIRPLLRKRHMNVQWFRQDLCTSPDGSGIPACQEDRDLQPCDHGQVGSEGLASHRRNAYIDG